MSPAPRAVADIGSNSARLLLVRPTDQGHLDVLVDARVALRLVRDLDASGRLTRVAVQRTVETLHAFTVIARRHGARSVSAVATSAIRDASNRESFVSEVQRRTGMTITVLSGEEEARLALVGAVSALPVESGAVIDLGGGSMEVATFSRRRFRAGFTLPLGALRLGDAFLKHDPPRSDELAAMRDHVRTALATVDVADLSAAESLVGTGGTIRALAKAARGRRPPALNRLHGYELRRSDVDTLVDRLARLPAARRSSVAGISGTRAESVLGGALVVQVLMELAQAPTILVSGYGVRQGVILDQLDLSVPRPRQVRDASVSAVLGRLRGGTPGSQRRRLLLSALAPVLSPTLDVALLDMAGHAARLVDAGAHLDHYGRWSETANLVTTADLDGFTHSELSSIAAVLLCAGEASIPAPLRRESRTARGALERAGVLLALADDIDRRLPPGRGAAIGGLGRDGRLDVGGMPPMLLPASLSERCQTILHKNVRELVDVSHPRPRARRPEVAVEFK
ncbi:MAG: Ppx/GppA family phosphatase [Candidatus Dormibacteraeota bacterium]|uniref:Ppx/GppA family phosphatase n=1 Tax=Candidatus Amunia macphersoniae TaxID=3127014 RepID=A0A934KM06_9BACT|nr:Ppx/GppA family phosphatase [Candidatus Dormibacteraeota bacterium]